MKFNKLRCLLTEKKKWKHNELEDFADEVYEEIVHQIDYFQGLNTKQFEDEVESYFFDRYVEDSDYATARSILKKKLKRFKKLNWYNF
jgi:uncharacterized protein YqgQ